MVLFNRIENEVNMQRNSTYAVRNITMIAVYMPVVVSSNPYPIYDVIYSLENIAWLLCALYTAIK